MPWVNNRHVRADSAEWQEAKGRPKPIVLYDTDGDRRTVVNQDEIDAWDEAHGLVLPYDDPIRFRLGGSRREEVARMAIADALGVRPDAPEVQRLDVTGGEYTPSGQRINRRPWLDGDEDDDPEGETARDLRAAMDEARLARESSEASESRSDEPGDEAVGKRVGRVGRAQAQAFAKSKGFESKATRRSQTPPGRHERLTRQNAAKWGVSNSEAHSRMLCKHDDCEYRRG